MCVYIGMCFLCMCFPMYFHVHMSFCPSSVYKWVMFICDLKEHKPSGIKMYMMGGLIFLGLDTNSGTASYLCKVHLDVPDLWTQPPLKGSKGHLGKIQWTHMAGWLDVMEPPSPHWRARKVIWAKYGVHIWHSIWSDVERREKGGWTSHRSCLSNASGFALLRWKRFCSFPSARHWVSPCSLTPD